VAAVKHISVVRNAMAVMELLCRQHPLGVTELSRLLDLDKSGVQRILMTLHEGGWIQRSVASQTRWEPAASVRLLFADHALDWLRARADQVLTKLRDETGETAMLAVLEGTRLLAVASVDSPQPIRMALPYTPFSIPLLASSAGRAVLSCLPAAQQAQLVGGAIPDEEERAIQAARRREWSTSSDETFPDTHSVAAPLRGADGSPYGALMVAAPAFRLGSAQLPAIGERLRAAARELLAGD
jgi:IclR family acetate operon transcriptional repressor